MKEEVSKEELSQEKTLPVKKKPIKKVSKATEDFKRQYFSYYDDVKAFNNGTKEDW